MLKKFIMTTSFIAVFLLATQTQAFEFNKTMDVPVTLTKSSHGLIAGKSTIDVSILKVTLSQKERQALDQRAAGKSKLLADHKLPSKIDLGMNHVPVLNQGKHGSCVTFAVSAAIDAVIGKGDYISQLCSLELGTHLDKNGYTYSGWDGSYGPVVLEQMMRFGIINKELQLTKSCASITEYPLDDAKNAGNEMPLADFKSMSENLNKKLYWTHLYSNDQLFDWATYPDQMDKVLLEVKQNLAKGHRLTFGTFLILPSSPLITSCKAGACASFQQAKDTWALTKELEQAPYETGGHEMVVTGYDDNAIAYDQNGGAHQGLLKLRNSWSAAVGDNGDFYMSYDYFKKFANEVQAVIEIA